MTQIQSLIRCFEYLDEKYMKDAIRTPNPVNLIYRKPKETIYSAKPGRNGIRKEWTEKELDKIVSLRKSGNTLDMIAKHMDVSSPTVRKALLIRKVD